MRYEVRWGNGAWKVFDVQKYTDVEICRTEKEAARIAATMNAKAGRV